MHLHTVATALAMIVINIGPSICLEIDSSPQDTLVFVLGENTTDVKMSWRFSFDSGEIPTSLLLHRLKYEDNSGKTVIFYFSTNLDILNATFYSASKNFQKGQSFGSFNITIKNMLKQIDNKDGTPYNPISTDYQYKLQVNVEIPMVGPSSKESKVKALVYAPPVSPALQVDRTTFCLNATVNITCSATAGNPPNTTITFYRNNVKIREVKNDAEAKATVSINLDKSEVQTFSCQAENLVGSSKNSSLLNVTVKDPPTITQCDNETSTEGDALSWTCDARGSQPLKTSWVKRDLNTTVSSNKTYNISSVRRNNAGMYRVTVSGEECPTASRTVYLTVQYKPEQLSVVNSESGFLYVNKGQPINITCTAIGNPQPDYVWMFKGKQLHSSINNTIVIRNATLDDAGMYTCTAINSIGRESINVTLQVNYLMDASCGPKVHTVNDGDNVTLNCSAIGIPAVNYTWTVNNKVSQGPTTTFVATRSLNGSMVTCTAMNSFGKKTCSKTLIVYYKPDQLIVISAQGGFLYVNKGQPINITCNATGNPKPDYVWSFKGKQLHSSINSTIVISNATLDDAGMYTCTAINSIGRESVNVTLQVNYLMDAICGPKIHTVNDGGNVALSCSAIGIPAVSYTWTVNNKVSQGPTTTFVATRSLNGSMVTCTATNSFGRKTCSKTLIVYYLEECKNNKYTLTNEQCLTLSPEGFPKPTLNCSKVDFNETGKSYTLCKPKNNDKCTIFNDAQECQFEYEVLNQAKKPLTFRGSFRCTNLDYQSQYDDKNSFEFKNQSEQFEKNLNSVYESYKIVTGVRVTALVEGSVIVYFNLTLVANVSDPLLPLKEAVTKGGGNLSGLVIDPSSIQAGTPTTPIPTTTKTPITTPSPISEEAIIAIAVVVPIVVILIIVLVWYFCCKKKEKRGEENISLEEGSPYRPVNGEENPGLSESQTSYAQSGPKSDHNGQTTNNNPDTSDATATYAAVDMSKKKKKKQEGEVLYADLGSMRPGNNKGTELQPMSSSGNIPDKRESDYASIDFFKTQKQGEVKEYECLGTFTCTDRKYTKALDNEMTDSFKKLRDEVNTTVKSAYKDDTNFVLVEAEHFKWHQHGTIVIFKLILKEKVADPFLPLKEALEKNGGVVGAMKIIPQSVKEHEEEQNATGEQKKAQKQDEANAAAKHNVGFLGGKETESSNQDNSSPESQADMSASRDNTTMTTVSL